VKIGIIGYGSMAEALGSKWVGKHELAIGGRDKEKAEALADRLGEGVAYGDTQTVAKFGEALVMAVSASGVPDICDEIAFDLAEGTCLIDITNPIDTTTFLPIPEFNPSMAEYIAERVPPARVVKAFNMCHADVWKMDKLAFDGRPLACLYCGDDIGAKRKATDLIKDVGADPVDLGDLDRARLLEPAADIVIQLLFAGRDPQTVLNLIQPEVKPIA